MPTPSQPAPPLSPGEQHPVLLVDRHTVLLYGLATLVEAQPDLRVAAAASTPEDALRTCTGKVHLAVLGLSLEVTAEAPACLQVLRDALPDVPVLLYSSLDEQVYGPPLLRAGAQGYLLKTEPLEVLLAAVRKLLAGGTHMSSKVMQSLLRSFTPNTPDASSPAAGLAHLTAQERTTLALLGRGCDTTAIARELGIGRKTAQTHRRNVQRKLGLDSANALVHFATELRLARPSPAEAAR